MKDSRGALASKLLEGGGPEEEELAANCSCPDVIATFTRLTAVPALLLTLMFGGLTGISAAQASLLGAALLPSVHLVWVAHLMFVVSFPSGMPRYFCEDYWTFLLNFGGLVALSPCLFAGWRLEGGAKAETRRVVAAEYMLVMQVQYWLIWAGVACWKSNSSFLDWRVSCAPILLVQLLDWWPSWALGLCGGAGAVASVLVRVAPGLTVAVEGAIPMLLLWPGRPRRFGVLLALLLGLALAVLTEDCAAEFSVWCAIRYFLFVPEAASAALAEACRQPGRLLSELALRLGVGPELLPGTGLSALALAGAALLLWPHCSGGSYFAGREGQAYFSLFLFLALVLLRGLLIEERRPSLAGGPSSVSRVALPGQGMARAIAWTLTFAYAFVGPVLGLQDIGLPHMYSNLELHGGSNHLLLPTGLLQASAAFDDPASWNPFAGGEVLVTRTNSTALRAMFPAERRIPDRHRALLRAAGHIGRQWSPETTEIMGAGVVLGEMLQPTPYTLPALEFRRVLAKARTQGDPFFVEYARLPGRAWGPNVIVNASSLPARVRHEESGSGDGRCTRLDGDDACSPAEPVLLPAPGSSLAERLALRMLLSSSYAIQPAGSPSQGVGCYNR